MDYGLTITCDVPTVTGLVHEGSALVVLSAVQVGDSSGLPLVWIHTKKFSETTTLRWTSAYSVYASLTPTSETSAPIHLGQRYEIAGSVGTVENNGVAGAITIHNRDDKRYTCGLEQTVFGNTVAKVCALPLYGGNVQTIVPLPQQIVLFFTTVPLARSEPLPPELEVSFVRQIAAGATGPVLSLDLSNQNQAALQYDINAGWSWPSSVKGARVIDPSQIVPALIQ